MSSSTKADLKPTNPKDRVATSRLDLSLFPATAIAYGALGMVEGDSKYGGYNYRVGGVLASVYVAACLRHLFDYYNGAWDDEKTRVPHLASAEACLAILIDAHECGVLKDDRPPRAELRRLFTQFQEIVEHLHKTFPNGPGRYTEAQHGNSKLSPREREKVGTLRRPRRPASKKKVSKVQKRGPRVDSIRLPKRRA